jgi:hypothetical protein
MHNKLLYWSPRIIGILAILFMIMFSIDCFDGEGPISDQLLCLFMHNIPTFGFIIVLIIAWKWELIGGILFAMISLAAAIVFKSFAGNPASLLVISPFIICSALFIYHHYNQKRI